MGPPAAKVHEYPVPVPQVREQIPPRQTRTAHPEHGLDEVVVAFRHGASSAQ